MAKPDEPSAEKKRLMAHYWEASITANGEHPERLTVEALNQRIADLDTIIAEREVAGLACDWLAEERTWRRKQILEREG